MQNKLSTFPAGVMEMMSVWQVGDLELTTSASFPLGTLRSLCIVGFVVVADVWIGWFESMMKQFLFSF